MIKKWNGAEVGRNVLVNGKITKKYKLGNVLANRLQRTQSCQVGQLEITEWARDCEVHIYGDGMVTNECGQWYTTGNTWCVDDENGQNPNCTDLSTPECFCELIGGPGCQETGGGGQNNTPPSVDNLVDDPCLHSTVDVVISRDCQNKITTFINNTFANSNTFNLEFVDMPNHPTRDAVCDVRGILLDRFTATITLYNNQLNSASQEYIAATILHEVVHAWIEYSYPNTSDQINQHNLMASSWRFEAMKTALMEIFPNLGEQDAIDLTWGGNYQTTAFMTKPPTEQQQIIDRNNQFKNHTPNGPGTPCP